jgi:signal transduction histidine kinase
VDVQDLASYSSLKELFDWRAKAVPGRRCWEVVGCNNNEECPVYNTDILRCWSFSDDHCFRPDYQKGGEKVLEVCAHCEVYRQAGLKLAAPREVRSMGRTLQATSTLIINEYVREAFGEVMVFHDITAEKQAEQQRSDFVSMITHDLKAPITSILGYCELMAEEQETGKLREMGDAVMRNSNRLLKMINDFLELSKLDAHKIKLNLLGISLGSFLPATVEPYLAQAKERGIDISWRVSEDKPEVLADMDQLSRIVGNLISNSLRYVSAGGSISITASKADGGFVRIAVEDDGAGIGPEDLSHVFERYYTGKEDRMRGAGLGLAIVKLLTDAHGGAVSVKSEKGAGAEFTVLLPAA